MRGLSSEFDKVHDKVRDKDGGIARRCDLLLVAVVSAASLKNGSLILCAIAALQFLIMQTFFLLPFKFIEKRN